MFNSIRRAAAVVAAFFGFVGIDREPDTFIEWGNTDREPEPAGYTLSTDPADYARTFRCLAEKTAAYGGDNYELLGYAIDIAITAMHDAASVGLGTLAEAKDEYTRFTEEHSFDVASTVEYFGLIAQRFEAMARVAEQVS